MKMFLQFALGAVCAAAAFGGIVNISTGTNNANWLVSGPGVAIPVAATSLTVAQQNGTWAPAPISISPISGANWLSYGSNEGTSCVVGQTPGNGCAHTLVSSTGDTWTYTLNISAAALGSTSGLANFIFGADNRLVVSVGIGGTLEPWNTGTPTNGNAFNPLGCSGNPAPTSAGNTQAQYNNCVGNVSYNAANLNGDGSLTITATVVNDPIVGCSACGDPTGFVLEGTLSTAAATSAPEPATFALVGLAGLVGLALRRRK
jgi:PEP-CTERM motif